MRTDESFTPKPRILTFGEPLVAMVPDAPGVVSPMHQFRPYPVGAELNTAVGLARLGLHPVVACCVGADPFGSLIRSAARSEGIDISEVQVSTAGSTAVMFKQRSGLQMNTSVYYYRSASPMAMGEWNPEAVQERIVTDNFDWVHATGITWMISNQCRNVATDLFRIAHQRGVPVSFDINVRLKLAAAEGWRQLIQEVLPFVTWLFIGDEEADLLFATTHAREIEAECLNHGFNGVGVVVKRGDKGATVSTGGTEITVSARRVAAVVDTVGAGDGFNAGFIAGLLRDGSVDEALSLGTIVGAYAVTSIGDYHGYPTWTEALQELRGIQGVPR
ncbi:sugar kinase [Alicyclobacillus ferrooxydans]|uniref:Carbohydrate kinase PfkB domain-containing protein n=1 Tax=Alicyclobacillus ferrooxydans TaxID=471514 RepID=A0A0N8PN82_9BACL|nr:sugar kinase [Alicyclobacillus ferrooxydans]KPV40797.1 hypothetical protein AN477_21010 [Alicyclobacillus ferrooxydans]